MGGTGPGLGVTVSFILLFFFYRRPVLDALIQNIILKVNTNQRYQFNALTIA